MRFINNLTELREIYGHPGARAISKVTPKLTSSYRSWIEKSNFCIISSVGSTGTDSSPRGDKEQVVRVLDEQTIAMPDWKGNNRIDTLQNIVEDGRVSLMFFVSGSETVIRINGTAHITDDEHLKSLFLKNKHLPTIVILIEINEVYFQCAKALIRSNLWHKGDCSAELPSAGDTLKEILNNNSFDGQAYDKKLPERYQKELW